MKVLLTFLILLSLILASCASVTPGRNVAAIAINEEAQSAVDTLFTFNKSNTALSDKDLMKDAQGNINLLAYDTKVEIEWIEDSTLDSDTAFKIEPTIELKKNKIKIKYAEEAFKDHPATLNLTRFMDSIMKSKMVQPYAIFEMYYNALNNDPGTLHAISKLRRLVLTPLDKTSYYSIETSQYNGYVQGATVEWDKKVAEFAKLEKKANAEKKTLAEQRKIRMAKLDTAPESKQLRYLVSIGDRKGAADLIEAYLPFEEMAPFEKKYWQMHLDIMRNPVPLAERVLIYRGIDDDLIQTPVKDGVKLTVDEAVKDQDIFVMSTMMTKNQGSWNRRLRSLTSMYEKFIGGLKVGANDYSSEFAKAARISVLFRNHAARPDGSPFLSFTPSFQAAETFGKNKISGYLIDPRALEYNFTSTYTHEREFLLPLATFPDEIIVVHDTAIHPPLVEGAAREGALQKIIIRNLEDKLGAAEGIETYKKISENSNKFFSNLNLFMKFDTMAIQDKTLLNAKEIANLPKVELKNKINGCTDILKAFWAN